jgi:hypothetical protein
MEMTKLMITLAATAAVAGGFAILPARASAQAQSEVVVYGNDPCPRSTESTVVVCRHAPENQRYRLPQAMRESGTRQQRQSWANKSYQIMNAGNTGIGSCSAVGPGGSTGCLIQEIRRSKQESTEVNNQGTAPEQ